MSVMRVSLTWSTWGPIVRQKVTEPVDFPNPTDPAPKGVMPFMGIFTPPPVTDDSRSPVPSDPRLTAGPQRICVPASTAASWWRRARSSAAVFLLLPGLAAAEEAGFSLTYFLGAALEHNRGLIQARERIEQVDGDRVVVRSRFMPSLDLTANYDALRTELGGDTEDRVASRLRFSQRLFEFGPNAAQEIRLRADLREAVYDYQGEVYVVTARVWELELHRTRGTVEKP